MKPPPPAGIRAEDELAAADVRVMLTAPSRTALLENLGITDQDASDLLPLLDAAAADEEVLAEVTAIANRLRAAAGLEVPEVDLAAEKDRHDALQRRLAPGEGLVAILALLVSTSTVRAWHTARDLTPEQSWEVLADLGQQMRVHRAGTGRLGLHQLNWVSMNWAGRLVHLGRLQFDLHRQRVALLAGSGSTPSADGSAPAADGSAPLADDPRRWVLGTHIPARGPLDPAEVDASFDAATAYFTEHYPELGAGRGTEEPAFGREFVCDSWLLSDQLAEITGEGSNLARFAARWEMLERSRMDDGALFFVFGRRPPVDVASLPRTSRLERGVAERLEDGRGWTGGLGRMLR
ncbi:acyltransferase domain-containing protein [Brachybacterium paraconglomeratum]|uniref:acyltransferase domain-containing protein n=1 Tax=Brachybacterium paraconglomeratum TaxID=173362 RepID=UPI0021A3487C|nr:acyltransferase domain-containing protein [Brachybacterium paraconglomeratum]MCT1909611.1 acyltransferase domain-containing protein [Brachybacterium paraconglomeratum]